MKRTVLLALIISISMSAFSQSTPIYADDFESYATGDYIASENPAWWKTWDNLPGTNQDGIISTDHAISGTHSVLIDQVPGPDPTDLVLKLGDRTTGKYELYWKMFIESGNGGYYNIQHFETVATEWAFEVWFNGDGSGELNTGGNSYPFTYPQGSWFRIGHIIDLDADKIILSLNLNVIHEWPFSYQTGSTTGTKQLGSVDFYATSWDSPTPEYFIDDLNFMEYISLDTYIEDFESYNSGEYMAVENPTWWKTWNDIPGTYQDGLLSGDHASSGNLSVLIDNIPGEADLVLKLGDRKTGKYDLQWKMFVESGNGGYYNIQHFEFVATEWAFDVWFGGDGTGELFTGGASYPFTYPQGTWFSVKHFIDLDTDWIRLEINGIVVHQWPFSYQNGTTTGTKQLGCVDFYATVPDLSTPEYYIDDLQFTKRIATGFYADNFESYNTGEYIAVVNPEWWKTWDNLPGTYQDGLLSDDYAYSGIRSVLIDNVSGQTDIVLKLGDRTSGLYDLGWRMYIEPGNGGYYNVEHFESVAIEWAFDVWFDGDGTGVLHAGVSSFPFTYPQGAWFPVQHHIDLDTDMIMLMINGIIVHQWPFSYQNGSTNGTKQLGCVDFFATTYDGSTPKYYIDDVYFQLSKQAVIPLSNWAVIIMISLIALFTLLMYRRRI